MSKQLCKQCKVGTSTHTASKGREKFPCCGECGSRLKQEGYTVAFGVQDVRVVAVQPQEAEEEGNG